MIHEDKEKFEIHLNNICELSIHFDNLYTRTKNLCDEIFNGVNNVKLIELRLAEIYSLFNTTKLFLSINSHLTHYEFTSLLSFWEEAYFQMCSVASIKDQNMSWMNERVDNFYGQYEIVNKMLSNQIKDLKETLKTKAIN